MIRRLKLESKEKHSKYDKVKEYLYGTGIVEFLGEGEDSFDILDGSLMFKLQTDEMTMKNLRKELRKEFPGIIIGLSEKNIGEDYFRIMRITI